MDLTITSFAPLCTNSEFFGNLPRKIFTPFNSLYITTTILNRCQHLHRRQVRLCNLLYASCAADYTSTFNPESQYLLPMIVVDTSAASCINYHPPLLLAVLQIFPLLSSSLTYPRAARVFRNTLNLSRLFD